MKIAKRNYRIFLTLSMLISFSIYYQSSSYGDYTSFNSEKIVNGQSLNFLATIERSKTLDFNCFTFFISHKYSVTTNECAHKSLTTIKKVDDQLVGNDYYKTGSNGLLLNSVVKLANTSSKTSSNYSLIFTEKFINQFVNVNFNYNINKGDKYLIPIVINKEIIYLYTAMLDGDKAIINFKDLPDNCEILPGSPIFTHNLKEGVSIKAMVSKHQPCTKKNTISVVRSSDIGLEIKKIANCVSFYINLPGYIDNIGKCNFTHYP